MARTIPPQPEISSKTTKIQDYFRTQIRKGLLVAGDRVPPERQLANTFGVSLLTVNKAMASLESEMLLERQTSRGTYIHPDVSRGQIMVIFDTRHFSKPELAKFYIQLLESLTNTVKSHGMRPTHILGHGNSEDEFIQSLEPQSAIWQQTTGILAMAGLEHFEDQLEKKGIPAVTLTTYHQQGHHPLVIDINNLIVKSYRHLVNRGCQRIALICNNTLDDESFQLEPQERALDPSPLLDRLAAITFNGIKGPGIAPDYVKERCQTSLQGYQAMLALWQNTHRPDGVIISDDNTAIGVGQAVRDLNIETPSQLKLVTQATNGVPRNFALNFTRYQFDMSRICQGAFGLLHRLILRERHADRLVIKAALYQGDTT